MIDDNTYRRWLRAAYTYYHGYGEDTGMPDLVWDQVSRELYESRDLYPERTPLFAEGFEGMSLYFLRIDEYPAWAKE